MKLVVALTALGLLTSPAFADKCRDPKTGRAAKCGTPGVVAWDAKAASSSSTITKDKTGRCHTSVAVGKIKKGGFITCPKG